MAVFWGRDGSKINNVHDWALKYQDAEYRRIERTPISEDVIVSTIWTGFDPRCQDGEEIGYIFESAILVEGYETDRVHSRTEDDARYQHELMVRYAKDTLAQVVGDA